MLLLPHLQIGLDDMFQYDMLARSLAAGNGFRWYAPADAAYLAPYLDLDLRALALDPRGVLTTFRAPLYPAFLALVYKLFGSGPGRFFAARLVQTFLGAVLAPMTYFAGTRLLDARVWGRRAVERAARVAATIAAAYPLLVLFPLGLATENLFFPLVLAAFIALLLMAPHDPPIPATIPVFGQVATLAVLSGVLLGLAAITRSVIIPFALAALLWIWLELKQPRAARLAGVSLALVLAPWIVRNSLVSGRPTGIETSMGYNLYLGYHPQSTGTFAFGPSLDLLSILDDQQRDQVGTARALEFMREDPARFPYLALRRLGHFFDLEWRAFTYFYSNGFLGALVPPLVVLALCLLALPFASVAVSAAFGAARLTRCPEADLLMLLFVTYLGPHVFILSEERFHLTLLPLLTVLAVAAWVKPEVPSKTGRLSMALAGAAAVLLAVNWGAQAATAWPTLVRLISAGGNSLYLPY